MSTTPTLTLYNRSEQHVFTRLLPLASTLEDVIKNARAPDRVSQRPQTMDAASPGGQHAPSGTDELTTRAASPLSLSLESLSLSTSAQDTGSLPQLASEAPPPPSLAAGPSSSPKLAGGIWSPSGQSGGPSPSRSTPKSFRPDTPGDDVPPPAPPRTASSIACGILAADLASQDTFATDTVVILQDDCYGHRFSRLRTTKGHLSMIVERPERLRASVLGVSAAYVLLGGRHSQAMRSAAENPGASFGPPPFKIRKTARRLSLLDPAVVAVHGRAWLSELQSMAASAGEKLAAARKEVARVGTVLEAGKQVDKAPLHDGDLYLCAESSAAFEGALGGVCEGVDAVFSSQGQGEQTARRAFVAIRPPGHHCAADFPSGFCWLNNVHVGIEYAAQRHGLTHAAILDFDLHHGDGSQDIAWARNARSAHMPKNTPLAKKTAIGYYSMHDINSYPCESGDQVKVSSASLCIDNAHGQSIWNVHLEPYSSPAEFWQLYEQKYKVLLVKARAFLKLHAARIKAFPKAGVAKAAIFISAGFDASQWEGSGMQRHAVNVPTEFYARFTADVVKLALEEGTACDGRVVSVLEGGYSDRALTSGVLSHVAGLCHARTQHNANVGTPGRPTCDPAWWSEENLGALEMYVSPPPPPAAKKSKGRMVPTYASPTASFTQKVADPDKFSKSASSTMRFLAPAICDPIPLPEVDWIVATHELSKLLIPTDRTTTSCSAESLAAPRVKKEVPSMERLTPQDSPNTAGRQLRERKGKTEVSAGPLAAGSSIETPAASPRETAQKMKRVRPQIAATSASSRHSPKSETGPSKIETVERAVTGQYTTPPTAEQSVDAQLDILSSGVRKLKLRVCSQEEWDRRESERDADGETKVVDTTAPLASAPLRKIRLVSRQGGEGSTTAASTPVTPVNERHGETQSGQMFVPSTAPPKTTSRVDGTQAVVDDGDEQKHSNTVPQYRRVEQMVASQIPEEPIPSSHLPVWNATGSIPFAPVADVSQQQRPPNEKANGGADAMTREYVKER